MDSFLCQTLIVLLARGTYRCLMIEVNILIIIVVVHGSYFSLV